LKYQGRGPILDEPKDQLSATIEALRAYIDATGIAEDRKGWLFRTARGHTTAVPCPTSR